MDPAEQNAAYREALARAEAAAVAFDEDGRETPANPAIEELVGAEGEQPLTLPEEETPAVAETVETPATEETAESLRDQIAQLEARLAEKDSFIGRQSGEVGELRQAVEVLNQRLTAVTSQPLAPQGQYAVVPITQELIEADPARATMLAFQQRDEAALQRAFNAWKDPFSDNGDPTSAAAWLAERRIEQANATHAAEMNELRQRVEQLQVPAIEQETRKQWAKAFDIVRNDHPEFMENAERILTEVAPQYPAFADTLANGTAEQKADVLRALHTIDRAQRTDPAVVKQELEAAATAAADEETATRNAAAVVTGQSTTGQSNAPELTPEQEEQERYKQRWANKASLERGWTGRS